MVWPETNHKVAEAFEGGVLPTMVYINKQGYEGQSVRRPLYRRESICEILLICKGTGTYISERNAYPLFEGSIIYYNRGELHEVIAETEDEIGSYCIGIANLRKRGLPVNCLVGPGEPCVRQSGSMFPMLKNMCDQIYELEECGEEGKLAAQLLCASFLVLTGRIEGLYGMGPRRSKEEIMVQHIRDYLNQNFTESISLRTIARKMGCSETYLSHLFKKETGQTPIQYVIQRRIRLAQTLLISTDLPSAQIAARVGYGNTNYFCTLFAKIVGMTPVRYRMFYKEEMQERKNQS